MEGGFHCEGQSEFQPQSKGCDLMHILECLISAPQGATVADVSSEMKSAKKNKRTSFQHSTEDQQSPFNASYCCVFLRRSFYKCVFISICTGHFHIVILKTAECSLAALVSGLTVTLSGLTGTLE